MQKHTVSRNTAFTIIEMLIVIAIVAALLALVVVGLNAARRTAQITRVKDDFQMITVALTQYRDEFKDYPRFADPAADSADTSTTNGQWLDYSKDRGARLLCQALISPGPATGSNGILAGEDGADGPGFRARRPVNGGVPSGKIYGPYLAPDKFKLEYSSAVLNLQDAKILDNMGNVILYFPARPGALGGTTSSNFVINADPTNPATAFLKPLYNSFDNQTDTTTNKPLLDPVQMQYILGNTGMATTAAYLLWSAGPDGKYGFGTNPATGNAWIPNATLKTDDITDFDLPVGVKK